jgi:hypothetical protein
VSKEGEYTNIAGRECVRDQKFRGNEHLLPEIADGEPLALVGHFQ